MLISPRMEGVILSQQFGELHQPLTEGCFDCFVSGMSGSSLQNTRCRAVIGGWMLRIVAAAAVCSWSGQPPFASARAFISGARNWGRDDRSNQKHPGVRLGVHRSHLGFPNSIWLSQVRGHPWTNGCLDLLGVHFGSFFWRQTADDSTKGLSSRKQMLKDRPVHDYTQYTYTLQPGKLQSLVVLSFPDNDSAADSVRCSVCYTRSAISHATRCGSKQVMMWKRWLNSSKVEVERRNWWEARWEWIVVFFPGVPVCHFNAKTWAIIRMTYINIYKSLSLGVSTNCAHFSFESPTLMIVLCIQPSVDVK